MRNLPYVVNQIVDAIPDDYEEKASLARSLKSRADSWLYTAPEAIPIRWQEVSELLEMYLGEPDTEWKKKVVSIFGDEE